MKHIITILTIALLTLASCTQNKEAATKQTTSSMSTTDSLPFTSAYADVNGLHMYYEVYGQGRPLVLLHGGGSTIQTSFANIIPLLAQHRQVIAVELQAHGRTSDRNADLTFEQDADDVAALLKHLGIAKADIFGFSNGGTTALQIAIRHPGMVNKLILGSALAKRDDVPAQFWDFMQGARLENMPEPLKEAYKQVAPNPAGLQVMHDRDAKRMVHFKDIPDAQLQAITAPALVVIGDKDVILPEHALAMHKLLAGSQLAIIPGGHGAYMGEITTVQPGFTTSDWVIVPLIEKFLGT